LDLCFFRSLDLAMPNSAAVLLLLRQGNEFWA